MWARYQIQVIRCLNSFIRPEKSFFFNRFLYPKGIVLIASFGPVILPLYPVCYLKSPLKTPFDRNEGKLLCCWPIIIFATTIINCSDNRITSKTQRITNSIANPPPLNTSQVFVINTVKLSLHPSLNRPYLRIRSVKRNCFFRKAVVPLTAIRGADRLCVRNQILFLNGSLNRAAVCP